MKKIIISVMLVAVSLILLVSCEKEKVSFNPQLLYGKWVSGSEFWRYDDDGKGATWDTADDVHEDEAQLFKWEYDDLNNSLTHIHWMEMTQEWTVPRVYIVTTLDSTSLIYHDNFGKVYYFQKITDSL